MAEVGELSARHLAVRGWFGSYGGEDSPNDISRGLFAGEVGVPRLLQSAQRRNIPFTWFWPGHSMEAFPEQFDQVDVPLHQRAAFQCGNAV